MAQPDPVVDQLFRAILRARVYEVCDETPLEVAAQLSARLGNTVHLKREDLHPVFSFKIRGAFNRMATLSDAERSAGVIAASAGNHAQGVAFAARHLGLEAVIVMPVTTPTIKVESVRRLGGEVLLAGDSYSEAEAECRRLAGARALTLIHPFDDPAVIAGQGTVGEEIVRHRRHRLDAVFVPVGGGGLIAGIGAYIKAVLPDVQIIGVEPVEADAMARSLAAGERVVLDQVGIFADGVSVRQVGEQTFRVAREVVDEIVVVDNDEICAAIKDVFDDTRSIMEPAGALGVAGVKRWVAERGVSGAELVAVLSGANMNFDRLRFVAERAELGESREALLAVTIPERPGAFLDLCRTLGRRVVTEFNYRLSTRAEAHIVVGVGVSSRADTTSVTAALEANGYVALDLSDNELAKLHIRHMVGGPTAEARDEVLYRFEFPERPGALLAFLEALGGRWNISLFHYRNHGSDYGRVLAGFEVPPEERAAFGAVLDSLGYPHEAESDNPVYRTFLASPG